MSNIHTNDVFDAFVAAKAAIDKVPELEAQIAKLTAELGDTETLLTLGNNERLRLRNDLDTITAAKSAAEVALDLQRKSNEDLQARFDLVVGTIRGFAGDISNTLSVVEPPKPEPVVEAPTEVVSVPSDPTPTVDATAASPSPTATNATPADEGQSATDPTPANLASASGSGQSPIEPASFKEAQRRSEGRDWFDSLGNRHYPDATQEVDSAFKRNGGDVQTPPALVEAKADASVPFAASTASPSVPATSTEPTSTVEHPATPSEDASLFESPWLKWGHNNTV